MKKLKIQILFITFLLIINTFTLCFGAYEDVTMSVVSEPVSTIKFGEKSYVERRIVSKDLKNKEITFQLKVVNEEEKTKPTGEIMLVIDNSRSMLDPILTDKTREDLVIESAKALVTNLLKDNTQLKIGAVSFSTKPLKPNGQIDSEGTIEDARLVSELTNNKDSLISAINNITYEGPKTDLQAGIQLAKQHFTEQTDKSHKYVIILTDGIPNVAFDFDNYFSDMVIQKTKAELQSLSSVASNVITMLTGITNGEAKPNATINDKTNNEIIEEVFGTTTNPTIGKFYYVTDDKIEQTITNDIYNDLSAIPRIFKDIKVVDTFSKEIADNFTFSYVKAPNFGTISDKIDTTTNSITWNIPELKSDETAIVQYKIKLKEGYSKDILDKVLNTHTKLDITYTDSYTNVTDSKSSDVTPQIKLVEPEEDLPKVLPKAGKTVLFGGISIVALISIVFGIRYITIKNNME